MESQDLVPILAKFHREVVVPDIERIVGTVADGLERRLRDEIHTLFDSLAHELQALRTEYHMIVAGVEGFQHQVRMLEARLAE